jgi:hypothetical protein
MVVVAQSCSPFHQVPDHAHAAATSKNGRRCPHRYGRPPCTAFGALTDLFTIAFELENLSAACDRLWHLDKNRLEPGVHYELNLQHGKTAWQHGDVAADPLFSFVDQSIFERPTFHLFFQLLDNYERGVREDATEWCYGQEGGISLAIVDGYVWCRLVSRRP